MSTEADNVAVFESDPNPPLGEVIGQVTDIDRENGTVTIGPPPPPKMIPSQTAHSLMTPDTLGAVPILVSWSIRNGEYQISKVRWGQTVLKSDAQKDAPVSGG